MMFKARKYRMKFNGLLNSHNSPNPIKWKDNDLKILERMVLQLINIFGHYPYENNLIRKVNNDNPSKGEKGH